MNKDSIPQHTYQEKRKCLHCGAPIPDQFHKATKFCPRLKLPDETIQSCHDDFHSLKRKEQDKPYKKIFDHHKKMNQQLTLLFYTKGENVTAQELTQFGINLNMPIQFMALPDKKIKFDFIGFSLTQITQTHFKISKHDNKF